MVTLRKGATMEENTLDMAKAAAAAALSRKAHNTSILDLRAMAGFTDFFVICSGISDIQVEGISEAVLEKLKDNWDARPWHREGERKSDWILLDYVDFVVHIFLDEKREYYNLERLWREAPTIEVPDVEVEVEYDEYDEDFDAFADNDIDFGEDVNPVSTDSTSESEG